MIVIGKNQETARDITKSGVLTSHFDAPCDAGCLSGVKKSLYDTTPAFKQPLSLPPSEEGRSETEDLGLSPIM
jgi:hypothetical protein